jgi:hypothetical protein
MHSQDSRNLRLPQSAYTFAAIFCAIWLLHGALLRLPYFWDETGYFVPAARDFLLTGDLIPTTTQTNAHPPLVMIWLALWWKLSNFTPAVTRTAMLLVAAFGLLGVWKLSERVANWKVATATTILTGLYSVVFAQSSLAQLDVPVMAATIWSLYLYLQDRRVATVVTLAIALLIKETALIVPVTIFAWELLCPLIERAKKRNLCLQPFRLVQTSALLLSAVPLLLWYAYHHHRTGYVFNPDFFRYNVNATLSPVRFLVALGIRTWHAVGYMNMFVLTAATLVVSRERVVSDAGTERRGIDPKVGIFFGVLIAAHVVAFALVGGAALARYMVPVVPLVILLCVATLHRRARWWIGWCSLAAVSFVLALVFNPPWRISPEDNLAYSDFVHLHAAAATYLQTEHPKATVLTAWPGSDELNRPFLGYVKQPMTVVSTANFTAPQMLAAAQQRELFDYVFVFNTKYDPPRNILSRIGWWNGVQKKFFDYHEDLHPEQIAMLMQGRIIWQKQRGGQWAAIILIEHVQNARLMRSPLAR